MRNSLLGLDTGAHTCSGCSRGSFLGPLRGGRVLKPMGVSGGLRARTWGSTGGAFALDGPGLG